MASISLTEELIPPYRTAPARMVTARSYLIDRYAPDCEIIALPEKEVAGGSFCFGRGPLPITSDPRNRLTRLMGPRDKIRVPEANVIDLRRNFPQNWAHFLNNHLPIVFHVINEMGLEIRDILALIPAQTPKYILAAAELFGLRVMPTDALVEGEGLRFEPRPWAAVRPARAGWVSGESVRAVIAEIDEDSHVGPGRVFLSRRDTRVIENEAEIAAWLGARGFVTIYPEDLDAAGQIRLFRQADVMVAVHGAGLAPLLYAQPGGRLRQLVEILPCGHMTDVYRVMADQLGIDWIGVRGRLKPEYVQKAYDLGAPFTAYSLDSFEVDLHAVELAFELAGIAG